MSVTTSTGTASVAAPTQVDPRGMRFVAAVTFVVLAVVLVTESWALLAVQAVVFAIGAFSGVRRSPYSLLFAKVVRPRLGAPRETEDARPPQFAQGVGFVFTAVALGGFAIGSTPLALTAVAFALAAAFLNAVFGLCLGCEFYLIAKRNFPAQSRGNNTPEVSV
jgi:hypothetical protein